MNIRTIGLSLVLFFAIDGAMAPAAMAQSSGTVASPAPSKLTAKAQRKADRKAAHAKKNAELSDLEKHGYQPAGDQINYPQNLQNAEKKSAAAKAASSQ